MDSKITSEGEEPFIGMPVKKAVSQVHDISGHRGLDTGITSEDEEPFLGMPVMDHIYIRSSALARFLR